MAEQVISIFPTNVLVKELGREFTAEETKIFEEANLDTRKNQGNYISKDTYILEKLPELKKFVQNGFEEYWTKIYKHTLDEARPRITQSWLNWTADNEFHHRHCHQNSYLSAVLYIESSEEDKIYFYKDGATNDYWHLHTEEYTWENGTSWWLPAQKTIMYVFPSLLEHEVVQREADGVVRTSLAANSYPTGRIGSELMLTELYVE